MKISAITLVFILLVMGMIGCEEAIEPIRFPQDASVNFYNASDLLTYVNASQYYIFIDRDVIDTAMYPRFVGFFSPQQQDFPSYQDPYSFVNYLRLNVGDHRFIFTDGRREVAKDTVLGLQPNTYNTLYIADRANTENVEFSLFSIREELKATPGKIRLRIIDLSPDADTLACYIDSLVSRSDTSFVAKKFLTNRGNSLYYGKATSYVELDTAQAINKKINLHFISVNDSTNDVSLSRIDSPSGAGRSFVVVIQGFANPTTRQKFLSDGSLAEYSVQPNLRIKVRQTY